MASIEQGSGSAMAEMNEASAPPQHTGEVDTHFVYWFHAP